jgi:hypothetical protein
LPTVLVAETILALACQDVSCDLSQILRRKFSVMDGPKTKWPHSESHWWKIVGLSDRQWKSGFILSLWSVEKQVFVVEPRPGFIEISFNVAYLQLRRGFAHCLLNDDRRLSSRRRGITLGRHEKYLQLDELPKSRLLLLLRQIAPSRADEEDIGDRSLPGRLRSARP